MNNVCGLYYNNKLVGYRVTNLLGTYDIDIKSMYYKLKEQARKDLFIFEDEYLSSESDTIEDISQNRKLIRLVLSVFELGELTGISALICNNLKKEISKYSHMKCRFYSHKIDKLIEGGGLVELFGVRRTGKTVSIFQTIDRLLKKGVGEEKIVYLCLKKESSMTSAKLSTLCKTLLDAGVQYLFIDEITYIDGDLNFTTLFSDFYGDRSIVMTGTDSAVFIDVNRKALFGRVYKLSTSYISYKEFNYLYEGATLLDYIKMGGLLRSSLEYESRNNWRVEEFAIYGLDYIGTSIVDNLFNYFKRADVYGRYPLLEKYFEEGRWNELRTYIYKWIQRYSFCLTPFILGKKFKSDDLGNLIAILSSKSNRNVDLMDFLTTKAPKLLAVKLQLNDKIGDVPEGLVGSIVGYFEDIECYCKVDNKEIIFPIAIRYGFACEVIKILCSELNVAVTDTINDAIISSVEGCLMEESIRLNMAMSHLECSSYNDGKVEIDIVAENDLIEVKRTDKIGLYQMKWLVSDEVNKKFGDDRRLVLLTNCEEEKIVECSQYDCYLATRDSMIESQNKNYSKQKFDKVLENCSRVKRKVYCLNASKYLLRVTKVR